MVKGNAGRKRYSADDHKAAYDCYFISRNLSDVQRTLGLSYETVLRWEEANYVCQFQCPYHGWKDLIGQQLSVVAAQARVAEEGITDPVEQAQAIDAALQGNPFLAPSKKEEIKAALKIVTADRERLLHWQMLYAKVFYQIYGVPLDHATLAQDSADATKTAAEKVEEQALGKRGMKINSMESGIRVLSLIQKEILEIERRMSGEVNGAITVPSITVPASANPLTNNLSPETIRGMLEMSKRSTPEGLKQIMDAVGEPPLDETDE